MDDRRKVSAERIEELRSLQENWDSYGARRITNDALDTASRWLDYVHVGPMSGGGIQIEVHMGGLDIEIEIEPDGSFGPWLVGSNL